MTNVDTILELIWAVPGLSDRELRERTGIKPHQQVNQICRVLADRGLIERRPGPAGRIVNVPAGAPPVAVQRSPTEGPRSPAYARGAQTIVEHDLDALGRLDLASTLVVISCSARKQRGGRAQASGRQIADLLPSALRVELADARQRNTVRAKVDESRLLPAVQRYTGGLYEAAGHTLPRLTEQAGGVVIVSGGYGLLLTDEPIGWYDTPFRRSWWPHGLIQRCLAACTRELGVASVVGFLSTTGGYAKVVRSTRWPDSVRRRAFLVAPDSRGRGGAQRAVPQTSGEALTAFAAGRLRTGWSGSTGLDVRLEQLDTGLHHGPATHASLNHDVNNIVALLRDPHLAMPASRFSRSAPGLDQPGLYSWWADTRGLADLSRGLGHELSNPIYAGQAGATRWPSGRTTGATLASRISSNHLRGNIGSSTFRRTLAAILRRPLDLRLAASGRLDGPSNTRLSGWIQEHLSVTTIPYPERGTLAEVEDGILTRLQPPLNIQGVPNTTLRAHLRTMRRYLNR